jgi:hypothetical protein
MKNLEQLLAENILRFGAKNLSKSDLYKIKRLAEQLKPGQTVFKTLKSDPGGFGSTAETAAAIASGQCIFPRVFKETKLDPLSFDISAEFYNNMVSLDKGLMSGDVDVKIDSIVRACLGPKFNTKEFKLEITGQATSANPGMTAGKKGESLDHPGTPYDGLDISDQSNKQLGNMYLAKQRAESIKKRLVTALTNAGITKRIPDLDKRITTTGKVVKGGRDAVGARIIKVLVYVPQLEKNPTFKSGVFANISVSYEYTWADYETDGRGWLNRNNGYAKMTTGKTGTALTDAQKSFFAYQDVKPLIKASWGMTFGVQGLGSEFDFLVSFGRGGDAGPVSPGRVFQGDKQCIDKTGKFTTTAAAGFELGDASWRPPDRDEDTDRWNVAAVEGDMSRAGAPLFREAEKILKGWLASNGCISTQQWNAIKQKGLIFSVLDANGQSGYKKPSELKPIRQDKLQVMGLGGSETLQGGSFQAEMDLSEFIQMAGGNTTPILTKTTAPDAWIWDQTVNPPTFTQVKNMETDPGKLIIQ